MPVHELYTRLPVWFALFGYTAGLALLLTNRERSARWLWTLGCVCLIAHILSAYHFYHHWDQTAALRETARQTEAVVGWNWSGGLYINYLFAAVWIADVMWWWRGLDAYRDRSPFASGMVHGFLAFIVFNATVVFKTGPLRAIGIAGTVLLVGLFIRSRRTVSALSRA
jgi:hypothetical protein